MMLNINPDGYELSDLSKLSEVELFRLLKEHWGYTKDQPLDLIGRLKEITVSGSDRKFFVIEELHSLNDGSDLIYPVHGHDVKNTVYVGQIRNTSRSNQSLDGEWVKARVKLSAKRERDKFNNPFALQVVIKGWQLLQALPEAIESKEIVIEGNSHIEKWVVDYYWELHRKSIVEAGSRLQEDLNQQRDDQEKIVEKLRSKSARLEKKVSKQSDELKEISKNVSTTRQISAQVESQFTQRKKIMDHHLKTLTQYIEKKATMLLELDLITQKEVDGLLGKSSKEVKLQGYKFEEIFLSDLTKVVSYIQAFMKNKGVIYSRRLLENFLTLLCTHDLIVLAGDSGSGKTNLVKAFAEAIGGKAVIVPVKPNWTSAEDLLGYYNPLEQKYLSSQFLDALFEAAQNPEMPYLVCLDEMNLARVEYYFADFLSLMEERGEPPQIHLYSDSEAEHLRSETRNFLSLIDEAKAVLDKPDLVSFLDLLRDEKVNAKLHELCGFREGDSLLKYHAHLRKLLSSYLSTPSILRLPPNVRIIGTINVDETTHYLSPKILDRAHVIRFGSPLLTDWSQIESEVAEFDLDLELPVLLETASLGDRTPYPAFDREDPLAKILIHIVREYLEPLGIEFGLRTVRQARHYSNLLQRFGSSKQAILNNIIMQKVLPKMMFDGEKTFDGSVTRKDLLIGFRDYLDKQLDGLEISETMESCIVELDRVIRNAKNNDWLVNYWSR